MSLVLEWEAFMREGIRRGYSVSRIREAVWLAETVSDRLHVVQTAEGGAVGAFEIEDVLDRLCAFGAAQECDEDDGCAEDCHRTCPREMPRVMERFGRAPHDEGEPAPTKALAPTYRRIEPMPYPGSASGGPLAFMPPAQAPAVTTA